MKEKDNSKKIDDVYILALSLADTFETPDEAVYAIRQIYDSVKEVEKLEKVRSLEMILFRLNVLRVYSVDERIGKRVDRALYCGHKKKSASYRNNIIRAFDAIFDRNQAMLYMKQAIEYLDNEKDEEAFELFMKSALEGSTISAYQCGKMIMAGQGCEKDEFMGAFWHWQAVNMNNESAMASLGYDYYDGRGVVKSLPRAMFWFATGAYKLNETCIKELADMLEYEDVIEGETDRGRALKAAIGQLDNPDVREYVQQMGAAVNNMLAEWLIQNEGEI